MKRGSPEEKEYKKLRMRALRAADPEKYRLQAEAYRRRKGMPPRKPAMSHEESLARARERERAKRRAAGMKEMVVYSPEERRRRLLEHYRRYRLKNADRIAQRAKEYREKNAEKIKEYTKTQAWKEAQRRYRMRNRDKQAVRWRLRTRRFRASIHPLHSAAEEEALLRKRNDATRATGVRHHIDHIIPISAGGYHHHENLQILPAELNIQKRDNPFWSHPNYQTWIDVPSDLWPHEFLYKLASIKVSA